MKLYNCDLTIMDCLIIVLLLESAIQSGLLPSNTRYQEVFDQTTVPVQIVDRDYQPHYVSGAALPISEAQMRTSAKGTVDLGDSLLNSAPIRGGRVMWQDDITRLNELRTRLKDTMDQLCEESDLVQTRELEYCSRESMDNLNLVGVFTSFASNCEGTLAVKSIIAAYDFYETLVERLLDDMTAMMVHLVCTDRKIRMNIQMCCYKNFKLLLEAPASYAAMSTASNPYGDGFACKRIADILEKA